MKKLLSILLLLTLVCVSCQKKKSSQSDDIVNPSIDNVNHGVDSVEAVADKTINTPKSAPVEHRTEYDDETGFAADSWEQGMYDGLQDGASDAVEGRSSRYKYKGTSSQYKSGYREGYDEAYAEGVKVTVEAQREYDRLAEEYGLDDIDDYSDADLGDYEY